MVGWLAAPDGTATTRFVGMDIGARVDCTIVALGRLYRSGRLYPSGVRYTVP